ncbi:unnamed protein product [Boreogadus saida]
MIWLRTLEKRQFEGVRGWHRMAELWRRPKAICMHNQKQGGAHNPRVLKKKKQVAQSILSEKKKKLWRQSGSVLRELNCGRSFPAAPAGVHWELNCRQSWQVRQLRRGELGGNSGS